MKYWPLQPMVPMIWSHGIREGAQSFFYPLAAASAPDFISCFSCQNDTLKLMNFSKNLTPHLKKNTIAGDGSPAGGTFWPPGAENNRPPKKVLLTAGNWFAGKLARIPQFYWISGLLIGLVLWGIQPFQGRAVNHDIFPTFDSIVAQCQGEVFPNQTIRCRNVLFIRENCVLRRGKNPCTARNYYDAMVNLGYLLPPYYGEESAK